MEGHDAAVVLYGSYASYHTAKTRSYLRKKGIPFVERPPGDPRFREHVRPSSGSHRIPQIELAGGAVVQDSFAIFEALEERFPDPPARPPGALQQWTCRVIEALVDPALIYMAWHLRWNFPAANTVFVGREFGRSFRHRGDDATVDHYGRVIADRMEGHRASIGIGEQHFAGLDALYDELLDVMEAHVTSRPYLFGGLPSIADHMLMGPLFGHLARDPEPAMRMKRRAPRVYRWTEHMNAPEIVWPELFDEPAEYLAGDEVPDTTLALLKLLVGEAAERLVIAGERFERWVLDHPDHPARTPISPKADEPAFGRAVSDFRGVPLDSIVAAYPLWVWQHAADHRARLSKDDRSRCDALLVGAGGAGLVELSPARRLGRVENRLAVE